MHKRLLMISFGLQAAWLLSGSVAAADAVPERVTFDSLDRDPYLRAELAQR